MRFSVRFLLLLGLALLGGFAFASDPQVPAGGSASFPYTANQSPANGQTWDILDPSSTVIATASSSAGWTVSFASPNFTVGAPSSATVASGYLVRYSTAVQQGPGQAPVGGTYSATFDVVSGGGGGNPPPAPSNLTATAGNAQVACNWSASSGATSYDLKYGTTPGGPYPNVMSGITGTSKTITGLTNGTAYFMVVTAVNTYGESGNSNQASATPEPPPPPAPTNLTATPGNAQVSLSWSASAGATSYSILRSTTNGGPYTSIASGLTATTYIDSGASNGTAYYYVATATNGSGTSGNPTRPARRRSRRLRRRRRISPLLRATRPSRLYGAPAKGRRVMQSSDRQVTGVPIR